MTATIVVFYFWISMTGAEGEAPMVLKIGPFPTKVLCETAYKKTVVTMSPYGFGKLPCQAEEEQKKK